MRAQRVVVRFRAGPIWKVGPPEALPDWDEHAVFIDRLVAEGKIVMGGPFSDYSGGMVLFDGITADEVRALIDEDPFVKNGVFVIDDVRDWTLYVGA